MDRDEYKKFCEKIRPKLIGILDANKRKYKFSKTNMPTKKSHGNLHSEKSIEEKGGSERDDASLGVKEEAQSSKINKIPPEHWLDKWGKEQDEKQEAQDNKF